MEIEVLVQQPRSSSPVEEARRGQLGTAALGRDLNMPNNSASTTRSDFLVIAEMVEPGARVIDIGCGDGELLQLLADTRQVNGRGVELSREGVNNCVKRGFSAVQGDADSDLVNYPDDAFDYAILSQTLQATHRPKHVLEQLLRIGRRVIVSFPNFGYWAIRMQLLLRGRMPMTRMLYHQWYETPNIHYCTIKDFVALCARVDAQVEKAVSLNAYGKRLAISLPFAMQNLLGEQAIFLLSRKGEARLSDPS